MISIISIKILIPRFLKIPVDSQDDQRDSESVADPSALAHYSTHSKLIRIIAIIQIVYYISMNQSLLRT